ncbi:MAG: ABC transporter ATP-binding protein [Bacteroidota bacterium]
MSHRFNKSELALTDIDLQVPNGSIFGFLGKNGAGKSTTIKLLLGLLKQQSGTIRIFDQPLESNRIAILRNLGSLVEAPSFYNHLSAWENLRILQLLYQCPRQRIDEVLDIVGLSESKHKRVGQFSLGMKQRLNIGFSILHQPKLLILDEPTNGLDPKGILEIRQLLKRINAEEGTTIFISSHLLAEIEKLVDHVAVIDQGKLRFQGTLETMKAKQTANSSWRLTSNAPQLTRQLLQARSLTHSTSGNTHTIESATKETMARIVQEMVEQQIDVYQVTQEDQNLESIFLSLTKSYTDDDF